MSALPRQSRRAQLSGLGLPQDIKAQALLGVVEADETYFLRSCKGQREAGRPGRRRGCSAAKRGLSDEQVPVLVARDRAGSTTDFTLPWLTKRTSGQR